jgi:hypothetical protein
VICNGIAGNAATSWARRIETIRWDIRVLVWTITPLETQKLIVGRRGGVGGIVQGTNSFIGGDGQDLIFGDNTGLR